VVTVEAGRRREGGSTGNSAVEATYPFTKTLADGEPLDGSKHRYTITFRRTVPPVNAFWSVTMYDLKSQLLIGNPINRYLINFADATDMKKNPDGFADALTSRRIRGRRAGSNWLPRQTMRSSWSCDSTGEDRTAVDPAPGEGQLAAAEIGEGGRRHDTGMGRP